MNGLLQEIPLDVNVSYPVFPLIQYLYNESQTQIINPCHSQNDKLVLGIPFATCIIPCCAEESEAA